MTTKESPVPLQVRPDLAALLESAATLVTQAVGELKKENDKIQPCSSCGTIRRSARPFHMAHDGLEPIPARLQRWASSLRSGVTS